LELKKFEIVDDNDTGIKQKDGLDIEEGVMQMMGLVKVLINKYLPKLDVRLP